MNFIFLKDITVATHGQDTSVLFFFIFVIKGNSRSCIQSFYCLHDKLYLASFQHAYRDGSLEEIKLRHVDADEGSTVIVKMIRFLCLLPLPFSPLLPLWLLNYCFFIKSYFCTLQDQVLFVKEKYV
jgi:hypothetical protein